MIRKFLKSNPMIARVEIIDDNSKNFKYLVEYKDGWTTRMGEEEFKTLLVRSPLLDVLLTSK
jgi:hypothetical protein